MDRFVKGFIVMSIAYLGIRRCWELSCSPSRMRWG